MFFSFLCAQVKLNYHVRVLVPCYKEELEIIQKTVLAALNATLPAGCARTVYLCDDGKDPEKRAWIGESWPSKSCCFLATRRCV